MKESRSVEREVKGEIMRTDVFVKLISTTKSESDLNRDVSDAFVSFRDVARRFSRFREGSELSALNAASEIRVSPEMTALVVEALAFYESTGRVFDPSIISDLEREGYASSYGEPSFGVPLLMAEKEPFRFGDLTVDLETSIIRKPKTLRIDLGGIAKGYAVDRVVRLLRERGYVDFLIDAGGDIFASGRNTELGYDSWGIDIADPSDVNNRLALLRLRDVAVATSGTDRRTWNVEGNKRHHLIDPRTGKSAVTDVVSATVVGASTVQAEVFAKTLCIIGREKALIFAEERHIPVFFVTDDGKTVYNSFMKPFLYDETA